MSTDTSLSFAIISTIWCARRSQGKERSCAEDDARSRLGDESVLAETMLQQPAMRSFVARYPWAAFVLGPIAMSVGALALTLAVELAVLTHIGPIRNPNHLPPPEWLLAGVGVWNSLPSIVAPIAIAGLLCFVGLRQRMPMPWVYLGVAIACVLGAFQQLTFSDNGYRGELDIASGFLPPFPRDLIVLGIKRAFANVAVVAVAGLGLRALAQQLRPGHSALNQVFKAERTG